MDDGGRSRWRDRTRNNASLALTGVKTGIAESTWLCGLVDSPSPTVNRILFQPFFIVVAVRHYAGEGGIHALSTHRCGPSFCACCALHAPLRLCLVGSTDCCFPWTSLWLAFVSFLLYANILLSEILMLYNICYFRMD